MWLAKGQKKYASWKSSGEDGATNTKLKSPGVSQYKESSTTVEITQVTTLKGCFYGLWMLDGADAIEFVLRSMTCDSLVTDFECVKDYSST